MPEPTPGVDPQPGGTTPPAVEPQPSVEPTPSPNNSPDSLPTDVGTLHSMIRDLRRENASHRTKNVDLTTQVTDLETRISTANGNTAELLQAKNARITELEGKLSETTNQLSGFQEMQEQQRQALVQQLPESLRDRYKDTPADVLQNLVQDFKATPQPTPDLNQPTGSGGTGDLTLDEALASGDESKINAAMDRQLG